MSAPTGDTPVTLKINHNGCMGRLKLALRDMNANSLETKLRLFLGIDDATECVFERYSDSASAFVVLDRTNIAVYKQLYRAAKAKQRLKIKVTTPVKEAEAEAEPQQPGDPIQVVEPAKEEAPKVAKVSEPQSPPKENNLDVSPKVPKPATVEDEPETATPSLTASGSTSTAAAASAAASATTSASEMTQIAKAGLLTSTDDTFNIWRKLNQTNSDVAHSGEECEPKMEKHMEGHPLADASVPAPALPSDRFQYFMEQDPFLSYLTKACGQHGSNTAKETDQPDEVTPPARPAKEPILETDPEPVVATAPRTGFAVCCNKCDETIPDAHYHCQTCDGGDFDLCEPCVNSGVTCHGDSHWLIKRFVRDGQIIISTTEKVKMPAKPKPASTVSAEDFTRVEGTATATAPLAEVPSAPRLAPTIVPIIKRSVPFTPIRTCNSCIQEFPENLLVHCVNCQDFDLCNSCFTADAHGHHPGHEFEPAGDGTNLGRFVKARLAPGRNQLHHALCDGCDRGITGVRYKCLDCPDWDYCGDCVVNASFVHEKHRFVPLYNSILPNPAVMSKTLHVGICCDGPLCTTNREYQYIKGIRYKCAVCHDTDFCANCEANPSNTHNRTHPLIKFKTPVRHVTVTTTGDKPTGKPMPTMGDRTRTSNRATSTHIASSSNISCPAIQTVVDVKPAEPESEKVETPAPVVEEEKEAEEKEAPAPAPAEKEAEKPAAAPVPALSDLDAVYLHDTVADGTAMQPNQVFQQTWTLRNEGKVAWPANCSVKFIGGDYMGHIDPSHPTGVSDLISANESTVCYQPLEPGKEFSFNVLLRTPSRPGKVVSYWRLSTSTGDRFGHRLWCDVNVEEKKVEEPTKAVETTAQSQMIFPKLEKESPVSSMHEDAKAAPTEIEEEEKEFEELGDDEDWVGEDELLTDDEYDLIDASDEEYCEMMSKQGN